MAASKSKKKTSRLTRKQLDRIKISEARTSKLPSDPPAAWALYAVYLLLLCGITTYFLTRWMASQNESLLPTCVYTVGSDTFSMKKPDSWKQVSGTDGDVAFESQNGLESFVVAFDECASVDNATDVLGAELMSLNGTESITRNANETACLLRTKVRGTIYIYGAVRDGNRILTYRYEASSSVQSPCDLSCVVGSMHIRSHETQ